MYTFENDKAIELTYETYTANKLHEIVSLKVWRNLIRKDKIYAGSGKTGLVSSHDLYYTVYNCVTQERFYFDKHSNSFSFVKENSTLGLWSRDDLNFTFDQVGTGHSFLERNAIQIVKYLHGQSGESIDRVPVQEFILVEVSDLVHCIDEQYFNQILFGTDRYIRKSELDLSHYPIIGSIMSLKPGNSTPAFILSGINFLDPEDSFAFDLEDLSKRK